MDESASGKPRHQSVYGELVDAVVDQGVVPFLGAGVSRNARLDPLQCTGSALADNSEIHHTEDMCRKLAACLDELAHEDKPGTRRLLESATQKGPALMNQCPEQRTACLRKLGLAKLSELVAMLQGYTKLVELLRIREFTRLQPTLAHHALAWLIREGAITEVLTTNYDTCLERALEASLDPESLPEQQPGTTPTCRDRVRDHLDVITCATEYMGADSGANDSASRRRRGFRKPRLYKINGCAGRLGQDMDEAAGASDPEEEEKAKEEKRRAEEAARRNEAAGASDPEEEEKAKEKKRRAEEAARRIVLTERQLQTFRRERWAEELFRDRVRCSHLLFSGFGSEEPQIRHTALALAEEFGRYEPELKQKGAKDPWSGHRNAPYVHAKDAWLSFFQVQMLWGYYAAWNQGEPFSASGDDDPEGLRNRVTGEDAAYYRSGSGGGLGADDLFLALFHGYWKRWFELCWQEGGTMHKALASHLTDAQREPLEDAVEHVVRRLWHGGDEATAVPRCVWLHPRDRPGSGRGGERAGDRVRLLLMEIVGHLDGSDSDHYRPFRDNEAMFCGLLLVLGWAVDDPDSAASWPAETSPRSFPLQMPAGRALPDDARGYLTLSAASAKTPDVAAGLPQDVEEVFVVECPRDAWSARPWGSGDAVAWHRLELDGSGGNMGTVRTVRVVNLDLMTFLNIGLEELVNVLEEPDSSRPRLLRALDRVFVSRRVEASRRQRSWKQHVDRKRADTGERHV